MRLKWTQIDLVRLERSFLQKILAVAGLFLITTLGIYNERQTYLTTTARLSAQQQDLLTAITAAQTTKIGVADYLQQIDTLRDYIKKVATKMISAQTLPSLIEIISERAVAHHLQLQLQKSPQITSARFYNLWPINIELTGEYQSIAKFFEDLATLSNIIIVEDFTLVSQASGASEVLNLTALIHLPAIATEENYAIP